MTVGGHNIITQTGARVATRHKPSPLRDGYESLLQSNFVESTSSVLFRRSCFSDGVGFRSNLTGAEDYDVYLRLARSGCMCCHGTVVSEYRIHTCNASHNSRMMLTQTLAVLSEQWPYARESLRYMVAFFIGSIVWRRKYGRRLTVEMAMSESEPAMHEDWAAWRLLATSYPLGIPVVLICRILPRNLVRSMLNSVVEKSSPADAMDPV